MLGLRLCLRLWASSASWMAVALAAPASDPTATIKLSARLTAPLDCELTWRDSGPAPAGYLVEWTANLQDDYVVLAYLPPTTTSYRHLDLMPESPCHYRVRAYHGPTSETIEVRLPESLTAAQYTARFESDEDYTWAMPTTRPDGVAAAPQSVLREATAAPTQLKATMMPVTVSGFMLTWTDHASDEAGYLVEMQPEGSRDFQVCAVLAPDINGLGYGLTPPVRRAHFRVRAFYYGQFSNHVQLTTGKAPPPTPTPAPSSAPTPLRSP